MARARGRCLLPVLGVMALVLGCAPSEEAPPERPAPTTSTVPTTTTLPAVRETPTCAASAAVPGLRFDGLYVGREEGGEAKDAPAVWQFVRFYPDGLVVLAAVQHAGAAPVDSVAKWLVRDAKVGSVGCWRVDGGRVVFSLAQRTGEEVRVDFTGTVEPDRLRVSWYSHKTQARSSGEVEYAFAAP